MRLVRALLVTMVLPGILILSSCTGSTNRTVHLSGYASEAQRNLLAVAGPHIDALKTNGLPLGYAETVAIATRARLRIVVGPSRSADVVSVQLENLEPGMLPFAVQDGKNCLFLLVRYQTVQTPADSVTTTWALVENYMHMPSVIPSTICGAETYNSIDWSNVPTSSDPSRPVVLG